MCLIHAFSSLLESRVQNRVDAWWTDLEGEFSWPKPIILRLTTHLGSQGAIAPRGASPYCPTIVILSRCVARSEGFN